MKLKTTTTKGKLRKGHKQAITKNETVIKVVKIMLNIKVKILKPPEWTIKKMPRPKDD